MRFYDGCVPRYSLLHLLLHHDEPAVYPQTYRRPGKDDQEPYIQLDLRPMELAGHGPGCITSRAGRHVRRQSRREIDVQRPELVPSKTRGLRQAPQQKVCIVRRPQDCVVGITVIRPPALPLQIEHRPENFRVAETSGAFILSLRSGIDRSKGHGQPPPCRRERTTSC